MGTLWAWSDENGIWGLGETPEAAASDALDWAAAERVCGRAVPITPNAYAYVEAHGYDCTHGQREPILYRGTWRMSNESEEA